MLNWIKTWGFEICVFALCAYTSILIELRHIDSGAVDAFISLCLPFTQTLSQVLPPVWHATDELNRVGATDLILFVSHVHVVSLTCLGALTVGYIFLFPEPLRERWIKSLKTYRDYNLAHPGKHKGGYPLPHFHLKPRYIFTTAGPVIYFTAILGVYVLHFEPIDECESLICFAYQQSLYFLIVPIIIYYVIAYAILIKVLLSGYEPK